MATWDYPFAETGRVVLSRAELIAWGATSRGLTSAVRGGFLVRARRDHYCLPRTANDVVRATRVGGRLTCVSALASYGVFAFDTSVTHVQLPVNASRLRRPHPPRQRLVDADRDDVCLHWVQRAKDDPAGDEFRVGLIDALRQSIHCQERAHAIASIDNALNQRLIDEDDLDTLFAVVPDRFQCYRGMLDGRAEAGQESVLRLIIRDRGLSCRVQPVFRDVGRADMLVERRVIVEADSRAHHSGWEHHVADRERDLKFAALGFPSLRPAYNHTMYQPELVGDAVEALVAVAGRAMGGR